MRRIIGMALALSLIAIILLHVHAGKQQTTLSVPHRALYSSVRVFSDVFSAKDVAVHFSRDDQVFYVLSSNRKVIVYDSQNKRLLTVPTYMGTPDSITVGSDGLIYVADSTASQIRTFSPKGEIIRTISVPQPLSLAVLSDGSMVVGSGFNGSLLHLYDSFGEELRSFGEIKQFVSDSESENRFLNRGKVLVDSSDSIYYVRKFAPIPTVQRFSRKGKLLSEFNVAGDAVDLQVEVAQNFLKGRHQNKVGGIGIINSATIDPGTNHVWLCMNGSSDSGVAYEYTPDGKKLHEYSFVVSSPVVTKVITGVNQIIVRAPSICLFTSSGAFSFDWNTRTIPGEFVAPQEACPSAEEFADCKTTCGTPTNPDDDKDCKANLLASINMSDRRIIETHCDTTGTSCSAVIKTCKLSTGVQTQHDIQMSCNSDECAQIDCATWVMPEGYTGPCCTSPILIDPDGNGFSLTNAAGGVNFDLNRDGAAEHLSWTTANSDDAFLVLDRNGNGTIDDGSELFGNFTPQPPSSNRNGFLALAEYDTPANGGNGNGRIDSSDAIFSSLRLWQDTNHNGRSEPNELHTLTQMGVHAIGLNYKESKRTDQFGNLFRYRAKVYDGHDASVGRWARDVFLLVQR